MAKTEAEVAALKRHIDTFFARHGLTTYAWLEGREPTAEEAASGGGRVYFTMGFDSEVYEMFWPVPDIEPKEILRCRSLRKGFDDIVALHGFWTEFEEYYRICFMSGEPSSQNKELKQES